MTGLSSVKHQPPLELYTACNQLDEKQDYNTENGKKNGKKNKKGKTKSRMKNQEGKKRRQNENEKE